MAESILMPRQGNTVESCVILSWHKNEGDTIAEGDVICEVETDKATFEVESTASGSLLARFFEEGDDVPVLTPIAAVGKPGEDVSSLAPSGGDAGTAAPESQASAAKTEEPAAAAAAAPTQPAADGATAQQPAAPSTASASQAEGKLAISPRARRLAEKSGVDPQVLSGRGSGPHGRIIERDVASAVSSGEPLTRAAAAMRLETGATAPAVGTGIGGRVRSGDLVASDGATAGAGTGGAASAVRADVGEFPGAFEELQVTGVRKIIAQRMHASLQNTAQLTLHASADARSILRYRKLLKATDVERGLRKITINDIVMYAAVKTVSEYPEMNSHFLDTSIKRFEHVHAGFAVDTDRGLMVPVIRFADTLTLRELSAETNRLAQACQAGKVNPDELTGGTFTVTNLGSLGIEMFTPVLNPPEVAILGVCSVEQKPVQGESGIELVPHIGLSLTIDHRGVDGQPAAFFLRSLKESIAEFEMTLAG